MIEILGLLLGLYHGVQSVEFEVTDEVAAIEVRLDGDLVERMSEPPWLATVDLGAELRPHELIAVALDASGVEVGRARRCINCNLELRADAASAPGGGRTAVIIRLDPGTRLPAVPQMQHWFSVKGQALDVLSVEQGTAEVWLVMDPHARAYLEHTASVNLESRLDTDDPWLPAVRADKQAFVAAGRQALLDQAKLPTAWYVGQTWEQWNQSFSFGEDANIRFLSPRAAPVSRVAQPMKIFNFTTGRRASELGLLWHSAVVRPPHFEVRVADAVAIAGLEAHASERRRVVVLMMVDQAMGPSRYTPARVRAYLEDLQVPLHVLDFGIKEKGRSPLASTYDGREWGRVQDLSRREALDYGDTLAWSRRVEAAVNDVRRDLSRQRVVWLAGTHLPDAIELSEQAVGIDLAGADR